MQIEDNSKASEALTASLQLEECVTRAGNALLRRQKPDGHLVFELEADATIPAEYIMMVHYLGEEPNQTLEKKISAYLRRIQGADGGWPLYHKGAFDMSASVKAYFALKLVGDSHNASHLRRAREIILKNGGAARSNVFTRTLLALYGDLPWRATPTMPVEIMLAPKWFPFRLDMISYWARTVLVPLLVIANAQPRAKNRRDIHVAELFNTPPCEVRKWPKGAHHNSWLARAFAALDKVLRRASPYFPQKSRQRAINAAVTFVDERLNGEDGLGAIFPAMVNSVLMYDALGFTSADPRRALARRAIDRLIVEHADEAYCQPCMSPVWDTALAAHALLETGDPQMIASANIGLQWLSERQIRDVWGDWVWTRPKARPGGWAFQYNNPHYPDIDDTAVIVMAMHRANANAYESEIKLAEEWVCAMQSANGGWGAFDANNDKNFLNHIPFADHGALLDPPTADLTARCISMLAQLGRRPDTHLPIKKALGFLMDQQETDGSWYGRWGMNYIYGTWSALCALDAAGVPRGHTAMLRAASWLRGIQNRDGGWGETGESYSLERSEHVPTQSTPSQTAWALIGLMAAGEGNSRAVARGAAYLMASLGKNGDWREDHFTATGFPRMFYLRYHGYAQYFPLWALARYRNLTRSKYNGGPWGM
jgi:squalene-hopene/tetraprenyl-beta-curcumene cyclase